MTSKERVRRAINFTVPDRLPMQFNAFGVSDVAWLGWNQTGTGDHAVRETYDEWGCKWGRSEVQNMGRVTGNPLEDWESLAGYKFPDPDDPAFYAGMEERAAQVPGDKYVLTGIFMVLFERLHSLRGFENFLTDLYLEPEKAAALADRVVDFDVRIIRNIKKRFPTEIDGISFTDDWGTEQASIIGKELFDEFFGPRYRVIFGECEAAGWDVWLHSCGKVTELVPSLLDAGVKVLELQQPRVLGIEEFGREFAGKVCLVSTCDIQHTLPFKSDEEIRREAKLLVDCWGTPGGGFIVSDYGDGAAIGVRADAKRVMYDAFAEYDRWRKNGGNPR
ncbi:MAG: hypothetical protein FWC55_01415 [Firmicutes bacterium]|nr:hypothetical protein [Bacillota bacterium]